jgi:hypothetical protein
MKVKVTEVAPKIERLERAIERLCEALQRQTASGREGLYIRRELELIKDYVSGKLG